jgi:hypothetical protein
MTEEDKTKEAKAPEEVNNFKTVVEKVKKVLKKKEDSLEDLIQEWRKCRSPRKRGELLRKIRAKRK